VFLAAATAFVVLVRRGGPPELETSGSGG
jgi:hypothetical protein